MCRCNEPTETGGKGPGGLHVQVELARDSPTPACEKVLKDCFLLSRQSNTLRAKVRGRGRQLHRQTASR